MASSPKMTWIGNSIGMINKSIAEDEAPKTFGLSTIQDISQDASSQ
jgi:hypothetical protein